MFFIEDYVGERSHWWHVLFVIVPDNLNPAYATNSFLYITGNTNDDDEGTGMPSQDDYGLNLASTMATGAGVIAAAVYQVNIPEHKHTKHVPTK